MIVNNSLLYLYKWITTHCNSILRNQNQHVFVAYQTGTAMSTSTFVANHMKTHTQGYLQKMFQQKKQSSAHCLLNLSEIENRKN